MWRRILRGVVLASAVAVVGCAAVGPDYLAPGARDLNVPDSWHASNANASAATDLASWWRRLDDPTLDALVEETLVGNRDVAVAAARVREARARRDLAQANRFPSVTGSASAARAQSSEQRGSGGESSLFNAGIGVHWDADVFGGSRRAIEAAQSDLAAAFGDYAATRVALIAEVARNYIDVRSLHARIELARANLDAQLETLQLTEWRAQAGLTTLLDVEQARAAAEQTRAQIPVLETSLAGARNRVAILAGAAPGSFDARFDPPAPVPAVPKDIAIGIPANTLRQRPDLRAAEARVAAETARIGQQAAAAYPDLSLAGSIGLESLTIAGLTHGGALTSQVLAQLAATIFDAGRVRAQVAAQTAVQERALHTYEGVVLTALEDVENALIAFANTEQRGLALADAVVSARNAATLAEQRYAAGITDFQTVLDTRRTLLLVEDSLASTEGDRALTFVQLCQALGGGWGLERRPAFARKLTCRTAYRNKPKSLSRSSRSQGCSCTLAATGSVYCC